MSVRCRLVSKSDHKAVIQCGDDSYELEELTTGVSAAIPPEVAKDDSHGLRRLAELEKANRPRWMLLRVNGRAMSGEVTRPSWTDLNEDELLEAFENWLATQPSLE